MTVPGKTRTIALSLAIALGAGYIVQKEGAPTAQSAGAAEFARMLPRAIQLSATSIPWDFEAPEVPVEFALPATPDDALFPMSPLGDVTDMRSRTRHDTGLSDLSLPAQRHSAYGIACTVDLIATDAGAGVVDLRLEAPCHLNQRVEVSHSGLRFAVKTSNTGSVAMSVPALAAPARFSARFADGTTDSAQIPLRALDNHERVALAWRGGENLSIHALEFGAAYGSSGHVWQGAPRTAEISIRARGGFLTTLGDPDLNDPMLAEIYSFPSGTIRGTGAVRLSVETEVTEANCGRDIAARSAQRRRDEDIRWVDLTLSVPDCSAIGDFLVLKNLLQDLNIARN